MKKFLALFLAMIMTLSLVACGGGAKEEPKAEEPKAEEPKAEEPKAEEPAEKLQIGLIPYYLRDDFYKDLVIGAQLKADELGVELIVQDPNSDPAKGVEYLENFAAMGCDAIALSPMARDAMLPLFKEYIDAGIPIVTFDGSIDDPTGDTPSVAMQFDFFDCGRKLGELVEKYMTETGRWDGTNKLKTAIIWMPASTLVGVPIIDECRKYLEDKGMIEVVAMQDSKADRNHSMTMMENILTAENGDIDLILGFNYDGCMGAVKACEEYGLTDEDVVAFSQLWGVEAFEQLESGEGIWKGGVAYSPVDFGAGSVQACYDLCTGVERDQICTLEPTMLTHENIDSFDWESIIENRSLVE